MFEVGHVIWLSNIISTCIVLGHFYPDRISEKVKKLVSRSHGCSYDTLMTWITIITKGVTISQTLLQISETQFNGCSYIEKSLEHARASRNENNLTSAWSLTIEQDLVVPARYYSYNPAWPSSCCWLPLPSADQVVARWCSLRIVLELIAELTNKSFDVV